MTAPIIFPAALRLPAVQRAEFPSWIADRLHEAFALNPSGYSAAEVNSVIALKMAIAKGLLWVGLDLARAESSSTPPPADWPATVMDRIMKNVAGETVCDPFMGTGSTGVAALRAGKRFTGIEHNPRHFETAVQRLTSAWADLQQKEAAA